jgi:hypothetical protein
LANSDQRTIFNWFVVTTKTTQKASMQVRLRRFQSASGKQSKAMN